MKKLNLIIVIIIIMITVSCSEKKETETFIPIETEKVLAFPLDMPYHSNRTLGYYHVIDNGETLDGVAGRYLSNDRTRWGEFLVLNSFLGNNADARSYRVPTGPAYTIYPGEIIMLPNDAVGARSKGSANSASFNLGEDLAEEYIRKVPTERDNSKLFTKSDINQKPINNDNSAFAIPVWLYNIIWFILVAALLIYLLDQFMRSRKNNIATQETSTNHYCAHCDGVCRGCESYGLSKSTDAFTEVSKNKGTTFIEHKHGNLHVTMKHTSAS